MLKKTVTLTVFLVLFCSLAAFETGKNPVKAMALSALIPGAGQVYNESYYKAAAVIALEGYFIGRLVYNNHQVNRYEEKAITAAGEDVAYYEQQYNIHFNRRQNDLWWLGSVVLLSVLDAFVDANLYNYEQKKNAVYLRFKDRQVGVGVRW